MATREVGKKYIFAYSNCDYDADGWVNSKNFKPHPFDIMHLKVVRNGEKVKGSLPGWWTGASWEGQRIRQGDEILYWKRKPEAVI